MAGQQRYSNNYRTSLKPTKKIPAGVEFLQISINLGKPTDLTARVSRLNEAIFVPLYYHGAISVPLFATRKSNRGGSTTVRLPPEGE